MYDAVATVPCSAIIFKALLPISVYDFDFSVHPRSELRICLENNNMLNMHNKDILYMHNNNNNLNNMLS